MKKNTCLSLIHFATLSIILCLSSQSFAAPIAAKKAAIAKAAGKEAVNAAAGAPAGGAPAAGGIPAVGGTPAVSANPPETNVEAPKPIKVDDEAKVLKEEIREKGKEELKQDSTDALEEAKKNKPYGKTRGLFGPLTFGPSFTLISIPHPINYGLEFKLYDVFGFGVQKMYLPALKIKDVSVKINAWDVGVKWHVFRGSFYIGANYGEQTLTGSKDDTILTQKLTATVSLKTTYITPMIGWRWQWESGFFMGMELGAQAALKNDTTVSLSTDASVDAATLATIKATSQYTDLEKKVKDEGGKIGNITLPHFTIIRFGWLF